MRVPALPAAPRPAFTVGAPVGLGSGRHEARWAPVRRPVRARAAPRRTAPVVAPVATRTPEGTTNIVLALERASDAHARLWVRVRLPVLPNGRTAWVPRSALGGYTVVRTRLVVDRARLSATLLRDGRPVFRTRVGVGTADHPTPAGEFYVRDQVTRYRSPAYGPLAFGTSARSATLTEWPDGGFVGIHGTDRPDLLPGRVSHGCIRLRNAAIRRLARLMPIGTPLTIR
jgi:lipoprotein-anchoring transpeptidase ErfK/SrfK